jgi:hypothetical protein
VPGLTLASAQELINALTGELYNKMALAVIGEDFTLRLKVAGAEALSAFLRNLRRFRQALHDSLEKRRAEVNQSRFGLLLCSRVLPKKGSVK